MGQSTLYALHDVVLRLDWTGPGHEEVDRLLQELSWLAIRNFGCKPRLSLSVRSSSSRFRIPATSLEALRTDEFCGFELDNNFFLTDGSSVLHLRPNAAEAYAWIAPSFFSKAKMTQANFWCFGVLKLLRPLRIYSLHAAGLVTKNREGVLLVGESGSGKSTLAIGLIQAGWSYLSDDSVFLCHGSQGIEALACRRSFYIDAVRSVDYSDFYLGEEESDSNGGRRCRIGINEIHPERYIAQCSPSIVIFPRITGQNQSKLKPIDKISALRFLLAQSAPQLFDRSTMPPHLELLKTLLQQAETYQLNAGTDLYYKPANFIDLLQEARGRTNCRASSLS